MGSVAKFPVNPALHKLVKGALDTGIASCIMAWVDEDDNLYITVGGEHDADYMLEQLRVHLESTDD